MLFQIGTEQVPPDLIPAVGRQKQAAAEANLRLAELPAALSAIGPTLDATPSSFVMLDCFDNSLPVDSSM